VAEADNSSQVDRLNEMLGILNFLEGEVSSSTAFSDYEKNQLMKLPGLAKGLENFSLDSLPLFKWKDGRVVPIEDTIFNYSGWIERKVSNIENYARGLNRQLKVGINPGATANLMRAEL